MKQRRRFLSPFPFRFGCGLIPAIVAGRSTGRIGWRTKERRISILRAAVNLCPLIVTAVIGHWTNIAAADQKPLKVFILAGQSNMQGHAHIRTFDAMGLDPKTAPILEEMQGADRAPRVCEKVWISSIGSAEEEQVGKLTAGFGASARGPKIGPEFTFGIYMQKLLDEPILIIKTAWGGKSLHTDFRPPSAEPYEFNESQLEGFAKQGKDIEAIKADKAKATGHYYRLMTDHVKMVLADIKRVFPDYDPEQGYELAGFVWFQGWNDMVDRGTYPTRDKAGGYDTYSELLAQLIRDVRKDLSAPKMPFVIGVMGVGGPVDEYRPDQQRYKCVHQNFRTAMAAPAALPEFQGNVVAVLTEQYWDMDVVELREKEKTIKQQVDGINDEMKAGKLSREEGKAALDRLYAETFSPREMVILKESTSNFDFHYMGSAKIMAQIGKGFAEAMVDLLKENNSPEK
jgi:alpha-galactosidase